MPEVRLEHQKWPRQRRWAAYDAALKRAEPWLRDPSREVRLNPRPRRSLISESLGMLLPCQSLEVMLLGAA